MSSEDIRDPRKDLETLSGYKIRIQKSTVLSYTSNNYRETIQMIIFRRINMRYLDTKYYICRRPQRA